MTVISPLTLTCVSRLQVKFVNVVLRINKAEVAATFFILLGFILPGDLLYTRKYNTTIPSSNVYVSYCRPNLFLIIDKVYKSKNDESGVKFDPFIIVGNLSPDHISRRYCPPLAIN